MYSFDFKMSRCLRTGIREIQCHNGSDEMIAASTMTVKQPEAEIISITLGGKPARGRPKRASCAMMLVCRQDTTVSAASPQGRASASADPVSELLNRAAPGVHQLLRATPAYRVKRIAGVNRPFRWEDAHPCKPEVRQLMASAVAVYD